MKKKTVKKRSLVFAISMLVISAITLTSSTFAWFSMGPKAAVEGMDLTVSSPDGIQISANAETWTDFLEIDEIFQTASTDSSDQYNAYSGNRNLYPDVLIPVSSAFANASSGYADFYKATIAAGKGTATLVDQTTAEANDAGFVAFDLFVRSTKDQTVYFDESTFEDKIHDDTAATGDQKSTTALRVAFQNMGKVDINASAANAIAISALGSTTMYEPNATERSDDATRAGQGTGVIATQYVTGATTDATVDNNNKILTSSVGATSATAINSTANDTAKVFNIQAGITKLRVYIWMEGNDVDCRDSIGTDQLSAALTFSIEAPGARTV